MSKNNIFLHFLSLVLLSSFSFALVPPDDPNNCMVCPSGEYMEPQYTHDGTTTNMFYDESVPAPFWASCQYFVPTRRKTFEPQYVWYDDVYTYGSGGTCTPIPDCEALNGAGSTWDSSTNECTIPPPPPTCPENEDYNITTEQCECPTPRWYDLDGAHCDPIACPIEFDGKTLRQQNDTYESCFNSYPPAIYDTRYVGEEESGLPLTCCYATDNASPTPPTDPVCDEGYHIDVLGRCVEDGIPPLELPTCSGGQVWDNFSQSCKDDPNAVSSGGDEGGQASSGNDYNTTAGDTPYNGGDNAATDSVVLEYNSDEVNDMLNNYSGEIEGKFGGFIKDMQNSVLTFYEISIPLSPSCGCTDIPIDVTLLGQQYNETVEICDNLDSLFSIITPLLWFVFLVGNLFAFFRGGN